MECDLCGETCRERAAKDAVGIGMVCPDCADGMTECGECGLLFEPEDEETSCPDCRPEEEEDEEPAPRPVDEVFASHARDVLDQVALSAFYRLQHRSEDVRKEDHSPRLRAELVAELDALDDAALRDWALKSYWWGDLAGLVTRDEKRRREIPPETELERRLSVFAAELRRTLSAKRGR